MNKVYYEKTRSSFAGVSYARVGLPGARLVAEDDLLYDGCA
jgi:hypothetical protein